MMGAFDHISAGQQIPIQMRIMLGVIGLIAYFVLHGYLLATQGQTIGKSMLEIRIADMSGRKVDFADIVFRRFAPVVIVGYIPCIGSILSLVDICFIFAPDRRCVHDHIAGTRVIKGHFASPGYPR
jgi:uncharacterized RDD family membrane protein YckC